jgi:hypothetical protein
VLYPEGKWRIDVQAEGARGAQDEDALVADIEQALGG